MRNFDEWLSKFRPSISSYDYYIDFEKVISIVNSSICIYYNSEIINIPLLKDKPKESHLGVFINNEIRYIKLVDTNNINASNIRVFINNT